MKRTWILLVLALSGCGYSSLDSELSGQVKKMSRQTPIICPNRTDIDISLGVIRNGVGSMSNEDVWATIENPSDVEVAKKAAETGAIIKATYRIARIAWCEEERQITHIEITN